MKISHVISTQYFTGLSDSNKKRYAKNPAILDYDEVVAFIEKSKEEKIDRRMSNRIYSGNIKDLTLEKLKTLHTKCPIEDVVNFHTTTSSKGDVIPFIQIYRLKGKTFSINSYMREIINIIKDYPNAIAKILLAKDPKTNIMPSLRLSKDIWYDLLKNVLTNADKKYLDSIEQELENNSLINKDIIFKLTKKRYKTSETSLGKTLQENAPTKITKPVEEAKPVKINVPIERKIPVEPKNLIKETTPIRNMSNVIIDIGYEKIGELADYINIQENIGNVLWFKKPYKNHVNPMIFTLFDVIKAEEDKSLYQPILEKLKQNPIIDFNMLDANRNTLFAKVLTLQDSDLLDIIQERKIKYLPVYDTIASEIKDESFIAKLKECNVDFTHIDSAVKEKSFEKMDKIFSNLKSVFYSREKSGRYILENVLKTKDDTYILDFWRKYNSFIPSKSGKIINKFITSMHF